MFFKILIFDSRAVTTLWRGFSSDPSSTRQLFSWAVERSRSWTQWVFTSHGHNGESLERLMRLWLVGMSTMSRDATRLWRVSLFTALIPLTLSLILTLTLPFPCRVPNWGPQLLMSHKIPPMCHPFVNLSLNPVVNRNFSPYHTHSFNVPPIFSCRAAVYPPAFTPGQLLSSSFGTDVV
jgi:hypothetical protein